MTVSVDAASTPTDRLLRRERVLALLATLALAVLLGCIGSDVGVPTAGDRRLFFLLRDEFTLSPPLLPPTTTVSSISVPSDPTSTGACGDGVFFDRVWLSDGDRFCICKRGEILVADVTS